MQVSSNATKGKAKPKRQTKTAEQHHEDLKKLQKMESRDRAYAKKKARLLKKAEKIKFNALARVKNARRSYADVERNDGPTERTLLAWENNEVHEPRLTTLINLYETLGEDPIKILTDDLTSGN